MSSKTAGYATFEVGSTTEESVKTFATSISDHSGDNRTNKQSLTESEDRTQHQQPLLLKRHASDVPEAHHPALRGSAAMFTSMRFRFQRKRGNGGSGVDDVIGVVSPMRREYKAWWGLTVLAAVVTVFFITYRIAFSPAGQLGLVDVASTVELVLTSIFIVDIGVNFNLAFYDESDDLVFSRGAVARHYLFSHIFWLDIIGVFPFYALSLYLTGQVGLDSASAQYLAFLRLFHLARLHRVSKLFVVLHYSTRVSLIKLTLVRNFAVALLWTHVAACIIYFLARRRDFDEQGTWIGPALHGFDVADAEEGMDQFERYIASLYISTTTFSTVGYGDFSCVNSAERIWAIIFMMGSIVIQSWIIGSITLLIVKDDEKTSDYRDTLETLDRYATIHSFDKPYRRRLRTQLQLDFNTREICDETVLRHFPGSVRRGVLRRLYLPCLTGTRLVRGVRQQFVDAFLSASRVEIFGPGEEILQRGSISSDLYLLVGGEVELMIDPLVGISQHFADGEDRRIAGEFINEIGFFTESPQIETVRTVTVCKTLTMSRSAYKMLAEDHPGSSGKILRNLLEQVENLVEEGSGGLDAPVSASLPRGIDELRAGSDFFSEEDRAAMNPARMALTNVRDLVKMHIEKQKDDHTTRFLFAASRGDINTISLMCDQGFDPNSSDYDFRTALMVAAMKGNTEVVTKLLEYDADPNLVDMHGSSALYEAARNGHESTMTVLLGRGAQLCMTDSLTASVLCQAVFDGDILLLRRLLRAGIKVDALDYDKRAAVHIAAAEGNIAALRAMVEFGADLTVRDRWGNTVEDEARAAQAQQLMDYLRSLKSAPQC